MSTAASLLGCNHGTPGGQTRGLASDLPTAPPPPPPMPLPDCATPHIQGNLPVEVRRQRNGLFATLRVASSDAASASAQLPPLAQPRASETCSPCQRLDRYTGSWGVRTYLRVGLSPRGRPSWNSVISTDALVTRLGPDRLVPSARRRASGDHHRLPRGGKRLRTHIVLFG